MTFNLGYENIDQFSEELDAFQVKVGVTNSNRLRVRLLMEDILVNLHDHYGEEQEVTAHFERRLSGARVRLEVKADRYNPLSATEDESEDWARSLFASLALRPQYAYSIDRNHLILKLPLTPMNPIIKMSIALGLGIVFGMLGNVSAFDQVCDTVSQVVLNPLLNVWIRVLVAISGPVIFFTATTTTLNTKHITEQGGSVSTLVVRYFLLMGLALLIAAPFCWLIFPLDIGHTDASLELAGRLLEYIFSVVPSNIVDAFAEANTQQLLLCAFVLGSVLIQMDRNKDQLSLIVRQANELGITIAQWASELVPYFASLFLCLSLWNNGQGLLVRLWQPLILSVVISFAVLSVYLCGVCLLIGVSPITLAVKLRDMSMEVLRTGSISYSLEELSDLSDRHFGISNAFARAALPQGLNLYTPISAVGLFVLLIFIAKEQQIPVDSMWVVKVVVMSTVLFVATPPVTGANLLAYVAFFPILGISEATLMDGMIFDIVYSVFANAGNLTMLQLETIMQAGRTGFLNEKVLRTPIEDLK